ncbi:hypothetical protein ABZ635_26195 [Nocardiopsis sp. NPDC007018]|uniref:hypothetical protein n=1 Tax=Nocardiopsis sp. NPDC007018 TaxID=3155721 RepID=UPI00340297E6
MILLALARTHATIARRQWALWITAIPLTAFATLLATVSPRHPGTGGAADLAFTGQVVAVLCGIAYAAAFTGLFAAPGRSGVREVEAAAPLPPVRLRAARLLGTCAVAVTPPLLVLSALGAVQTNADRPWSLLAAVGVTVTIVVPAALLAMTLSGLLGSVLPRALGRVAAVLAWLYLTLSTPLAPIPHLNGTVLGVVGDPVASGYFGSPPVYAPAGPLGLEGTPVTATASLLWQALLVILLTMAGSALAHRPRTW